MVVGAESVASLRQHDPAVPIVALIPASSPTESVLAQAAGADVVLDAPHQLADVQRTPGLDIATQAARTIAHRRNVVASASRRAGHDVAEALNVIALAADAGRHGRLDAEVLFDRIGELAHDAGATAWRAGEAARSTSLVITKIDLRRLFGSAAFQHNAFRHAADGSSERAAAEVDGDVEVAVAVDSIAPEHDFHVFADERRLVEAVEELIANARRADATRIDVEVAPSDDDGRVAVVVSDDGHGFGPTEQPSFAAPFAGAPTCDRLGLGLATVAERVIELGGTLELVDPGGPGRRTRIAMSLPTIGAADTAPAAPVDQATAQADILERVVRRAPLHESLEAIVTAIEQQLPGAVCSILLLHGGRHLHHGAGGRLPAEYRQTIDGIEIGVGQGSCGTAAFLRRPVVAGDVEVDRHWIDYRELASRHHLRSCWSTPIVAEGGEVLGTFAVYRDMVWRPDAAATRLVNRFTHLAAVAIEHHRLFEALAESEARFRSAFDGAATGIALISLDGSIIKVNPVFSGLVGRTATQLTGTNLLDLIDPSHVGEIRASWLHLSGSDPSDSALPSVDVRLTTRSDAPTTWLSVHTTLIPGEPDQQPYLYVEVRDITAARRQLADLRARRDAEAANRAKTDFLALASHELRSPLNAILGFAQVMQLVDLDDEQRAHSVEQIVDAGRHLRDLIDEVLDLSRIESGQLAVAAEPVDTVGVIDDVLALVQPLASSRGIELVDSTAERSTPHVVADPRYLRQALINLLDNAVKYTPTGGRVEVAVAQSQGESVRISVSDTGPGIAPDSLDDVFAPFHRLERADGDECEGTGLGLALCARLMREMGGSVGVASTLGTGSTFWLDLPGPPRRQERMRPDVTSSTSPPSVATVR